MHLLNKGIKQVKDIYQVIWKVSTWNHLFILWRHHIFFDLCSYVHLFFSVAFYILTFSVCLMDFLTLIMLQTLALTLFNLSVQGNPTINDVSYYPISNFSRENLSDPVWIRSICSPFSCDRGEGYKRTAFSRDANRSSKKGMRLLGNYWHHYIVQWISLMKNTCLKSQVRVMANLVLSLLER